MKSVYFCAKPRSLLHSATLLCLLGSSTAVLADIPSGYYDSVNNANPQALRNTLHEVIKDHQRYPYTSTSTDTWDVLEAADEDPINPNNVIDVYKNASYPKMGGGNDFYNREHSWPKSYGFPNDTSSNYPYTDGHHLFIADSGYNSSRSNKPYGDCTVGCSEKVTVANNNHGGGAGESNWTEGSLTNGTWQTWSGRKGDTARALMYMAVRYEGGFHSITGAAEPDLILTDDLSLINGSNQGSNLAVAYMGMKSVLLQWHKEDPVDAYEQRRNDTVYLYQGNRNPFIDHPEYAACVFQNICSGSTGDTTAPSAPVSFSATGGDGQVSLSWAANAESDLAGYNVYRGTVSGVSVSKVNSAVITGTTFVDTNVTDNTTYYYIVNALDTSYNQSIGSLEAVATTNTGSTPPPPPPPSTGGTSVWINEFHYDNAGADSDEGVEIAGAAGTDLTGWSLVAYNGSGGASYMTVGLTGVIGDQSNGIGTLSFAMVALQNGAPDGIALVDNAGVVVQFVSYEGSFTATNGAASGMTAVDVGVAETSSTPVGYSLQLVGTGNSYADFSWQAAAVSSFAAVNQGQSFKATTPPPPVNQLPIAAFSQNCYAMACVFNADASQDPDGSLVAYSWDFGDGETSTEVNPVHGYALDGEYNVVLTITDDAGATDSIANMIAVVELKNQPWINEIHYDNASTDQNEGLEIAGAAGTDLNGWTIIAYNGSNGKQYDTVNLSAVIEDQGHGFGTTFVAIAGLQNGAPDGLALVNNGGQLVQFLSYEGTVTATDGIAAGFSSTDIGVSETGSTPVGFSLQLAGEGTEYSDFTWQPAAASTSGTANNDQSIRYPNQLPVADFTASCIGLRCTFDANASTDAEGPLVAYAWDFGDGYNATGATTAYHFGDIGEYSVVLTVTDSDGASAQTVLIMNIVEQTLFENNTIVVIADHGTTASEIVVDRTVVTQSVKVNVDISHEHRGNIKLVLVSPNGRKYTMKKHKRTDREQDINETYSVNFRGSAAGTWVLLVKDQYKKDVGQLNRWSVQF